MAAVSDFVAVTVSAADTPLTFDHTFKGGAWLVGANANTALVHIRKTVGCLPANAPPIPNASVAGSYAEFFPLQPYYTKPGVTLYLTPMTETVDEEEVILPQVIYVIPALD